jgi:hypothetical protein
MKILVACEESQAVCKAFRAKGHEAYSCDILPCSGGHPEWHLQEDVLLLLDEPWDMMIAFPPCTHLAVSGAVYWEEKQKDGRQQSAVNFFMKFVNSTCDKVAIENPVGFMNTYYRKPDQIIHPYMFGDKEMKKTCLWLKGLPLLEKTSDDKKPEPYKYIIRKSGRLKGQKYNYYWRQNKTAKVRSKTFPGIAAAMAEQWGKQ